MGVIEGVGGHLGYGLLFRRSCFDISFVLEFPCRAFCFDISFVLEFPFLAFCFCLFFRLRRMAFIPPWCVSLLLHGSYFFPLSTVGSDRWVVTCYKQNRSLLR